MPPSICSRRSLLEHWRYQLLFSPIARVHPRRTWRGWAPQSFRSVNFFVEDLRQLTAEGFLVNVLLILYNPLPPPKSQPSHRIYRPVLDQHRPAIARTRDLDLPCWPPTSAESVHLPPANRPQLRDRVILWRFPCVPSTRQQADHG